VNEKPETRNEKQKEGRRVWLTRYLPLLIWIGVIFFLSSGQGASTNTSLFIRPLLEFFFPGAPIETIAFYHGLIRKLAHFTEYAVLGVLASRAFVDSFRSSFYFLAGGLVVLVAIADETNQSFNPARTGSLVDVLIDLSGGLFGVLVFYLVQRRPSRRR
jgi:VanZ family protein